MEINKAKTKISKYYGQNRTMPSFSEMAEMLGYRSKNSVHRLVAKLMDDGFVSKDNRGGLVPGRAFGAVRMLGYVEAGFPTATEEELVDTVDIDRLLVGNREKMFMLRVSGESMIEEGINDGDYVLVERTADARDGDIIVAFIDGGYTVKFLRRKNGRAYLEPANRNFPNIVPREGDELQICAVVRAVIRKY